MLCSEGRGERAGARTQDQRLKRAMLYQLSYPLAPEQVSTMGREPLMCRFEDVQI